MITPTVEELSKMTIPELLKDHIMGAMFANSCTMGAHMMGVTGEGAVIAHAICIGTSLAANEILEPGDMTGFDGYMAKIAAIIKVAYIMGYTEIKAMHDEEMNKEGRKRPHGN